MPLDTSLPLYGRKEYMARQDQNYRRDRARKQDQITDQQMAMNREKLDYDKQQAKAKGLNLDVLAEAALLRKVQGVGTSEDDQILQAYSLKEGGSTSYKPDESGRVVAVTEPALWDRLKEIGSQPYVPPMPRGMDNSMGQSSNPAIETTYDEIQPRMMSQDDVEAQMGNVGQGGVVEGAPGVSLNNKSDFSQMYGSGVTPTDYMRSGPKAQQKQIESDIGIDEYGKKKEIDSFWKGVELDEAAITKQSNFESKLNEYIDEVGDLISSDTFISELPEDANIADVIKNLSATAQASNLGRTAGNAIGTKAASAMTKMQATHPLIFGELRDLLGMTGKELDTKVEQDYYKGIIPTAGKEITTVLETLGELSDRFGTGDSAQKIEALKARVEKKKDVSSMTYEQKIQRINELKAKRDAANTQ